jgi:murein DD-endopeptidase MepM/ murein hydrolase activator NlpD
MRTFGNPSLSAARLEATGRSAALSKAVAALSESRAALRTAEDRYSFAKAQYDDEMLTASALADVATAAAAEAADSTRLLVQAMRPSGSPSQGVSPIDVFFGDGSDGALLDELSTVDRLNSLSSDLDTLADRADRDNLRADAAKSHAEQALAAAEQLPLDEAREELAAAQQAVDAASAVLDSLRAASAAATSIVALPLVPTDDGRLSDQAWTAPGTGPITDRFGLRPDRPAGAGPFHYAIDIGTGCNAWIVAAAAGTVSAAGPYGGLGNRVVIDHGDGITTSYAHIADGGIAVTPGQLVAAGEAIALSGSTGVSTGCHLHFEVALDGVRTDPLPFLAARGVSVG